MTNPYKRLDAIASIHTRLKETDSDGIGYCFVTGEKVNYWNSDCGHFVLRSNIQFRWNVDNLHIQSVDSNRFDNPNHMYNLYRVKMIEKYGFPKIENMEKQAKFDTKMFDFEKKELFRFLKMQCRTMLRDKNFRVELP